MKYSDFLNYCASFYLTGHDPIYPLAHPDLGFLSSTDLMDACYAVMVEAGDNFCGDSIDREHVAQLLLADGYEYPETNIKISA